MRCPPRAAVLRAAYGDDYRQEIDRLIAAFESTHGRLPLTRDWCMAEGSPRRLFLDSGVILEGSFDAQRDWVISSNQARWGPDLAERTGLRIATPLQFLDHCAVHAG